MLRINLLPVKAARRVQRGRLHLVIYLGSVVAAVGILIFVHFQFVKKDTSTLVQEIDQVRRQTRATEAKTGDVSHLKHLKRKYLKRKKAFRRVLSGCYCTCGQSKDAVDCMSLCPPTEAMQRTCPGPVLWMRELSHILSERWGPTLKDGLDPTCKVEYYNPNWDPTGLWLKRWTQTEGGIQVVGGARANGDVAEFERRLRVSRYFENVEVERTSLVEDKDHHIKYYEFELRAALVM